MVWEADPVILNISTCHPEHLPVILNGTKWSEGSASRPHDNVISSEAERSLFLETTDREAARPAVAERRIDAATIVEAQVVRAAAIRRRRPTEAVVTDIAQHPNVEVAITRSRIPDGGGTAELAGEVHASAGAIV